MTNVERKLSELNEVLDLLYKKEVSRRIRMKYDIDDELAIGRQKEDKPDEWAEFNAYCEKCKVEAKREIYGGEK